MGVGRRGGGEGKRGVDWWANLGESNGRVGERERGNEKGGKVKRWRLGDEEDEDVVGGGDPTVELLKGWVTLVTGALSEEEFTPGNQGRKKVAAGKKGKKGKENKGGGGNDLANLAMRFALGRARSAWDDVVGGVQGVEQAAVGTGKRSRTR